MINELNEKIYKVKKFKDVRIYSWTLKKNVKIVKVKYHMKGTKQTIFNTFCIAKLSTKN